MTEKEVRALYRELTLALIEKKLTVTTMESCTSGQIASLITDTEGASAVLKGAYITYSNEAKVKCGVPKEVIDTYSVYSKETARAMAQAARKAYSADFGIGVTGTMGNVDPANKEASVPGQVWFCISEEGKDTEVFAKLSPEESRLLYKLKVGELIGQKLKELLNEK